MEKLQEWMTEKGYGLNGTKDKVSRRSRSCCQPRPSDPLASPGHCSKGPRASRVVAQTLKIRGNPKVFIEMTPPTFAALPHHPPPHYYLTASPLSDLTRSSST